jgi:hypothetical protein
MKMMEYVQSKEDILTQIFRMHLHNTNSALLEQLIEIPSKYNSSEYNVNMGMRQFAHGSDETLGDKKQSHR